MLHARRLPCELVLSLGRQQAHCVALYLSNEELAPQMVCTTGRHGVKAKYQELLWVATPLEQRAQGLCESIGVL